MKIPAYRPLAALLFAAGSLAAHAMAQDSLLVADFERKTNHNVIDGFWYFLDDRSAGGDSRVLSGDTSVHPVTFSTASFDTGYRSKYSGRLRFAFGKTEPSCGEGCTFPPEVAIGTNVVPAGQKFRDLHRARRMTFWARADRPLKVSVVYVTAAVKDMGYHRAQVSIGTEWARHAVHFDGYGDSTLQSPFGSSAGTPVPSGTTVAVHFTVQKSVNPGMDTGTLLLDDLRFHLGEPPTALAPARASRASRFARAAEAGGPLALTIPEAYRAVAGRVALADLSGRVVAEAAFGPGQDRVLLALRPGSRGPLFPRVLPATGR